MTKEFTATPAADAARPDPAAAMSDAADSVEPYGSARPRWMRPVEWVWKDQRVASAVAVVVVAVWAAVAGWWTPRGPLTTVQVLVAMAVSLPVGTAAGFVMRSRWAMLLAPVVFVAVFEIVRRGTDGPTVDGIHTSTYGLLALVVGRGFHGVVVMVPMLLGSALGAGLARQIHPRPDATRRRAWVFVGRGGAVVTTIALIVVAVLIARPARTDTITVSDGNALPNSVAELTRVEIGGHDLAMMIRGHSRTNRVVLFLAGGPGGTEMGAMRRHLEALERDFVVVTWDQRGTGKSYRELDPVSTLTLENAVRDTIEVTDYLRERFDQERIYLVGQSYGTILGVLAVQQRPDLYTAYIGTGQMVSPLETDRIFYDDTLAWARQQGKDGLVNQLTDIGPPPYENILDYETALSYEHDVYPYDHSPNSEGEGGFSENLFVEEYSLVEQVHNLGAFLDTFSVLYPQIQHIDFRSDANRLDVPVYFIQGAYEAAGRAAPFAEWFEMLKAPTKQTIVLETSGHRPLFEQPERFTDVMTNTVLAETTPG